MILADKIINLRKKFGWSQEELADKMNVSRQSVSKWESARSIPDLNKILMLSKIFGVSTDYLVKDEIEDLDEAVEDAESTLQKISLEDANQYVKSKVETAKMTALGVIICVNAIVPLFILLALAESNTFGLTSNTATIFGFISLFVIIAFGVSILIRGNLVTSDVEKLEAVPFELEYGVRGIFKERIKEYKPTYISRVTISVLMFMTSFLPLVTAAMLRQSSMIIYLMVALLISIIALGVFLLVPVSLKYNALTFIAGEGNYSPYKKKELRRIEKFAAFYWPLITAIYIGWSLWTMAWGITWIVWPVGALAFAALIGLLGLFDKDED